MYVWVCIYAIGMYTHWYECRQTNMSMCMHISVYVLADMHGNVFLCTYIHILHACVCMHAYMCMYICYINIYIYVCIYVGRLCYMNIKIKVCI